jgi:hypothetical protein
VRLAVLRRFRQVLVLDRDVDTWVGHGPDYP